MRDVKGRGATPGRQGVPLELGEAGRGVRVRTRRGKVGERAWHVFPRAEGRAGAGARDRGVASLAACLLAGVRGPAGSTAASRGGCRLAGLKMSGCWGWRGRVESWRPLRAAKGAWVLAPWAVGMAGSPGLGWLVV